eukprot:4369363-Ditylum_brightwellii.AAC.1
MKTFCVMIMVMAALMAFRGDLPDVCQICENRLGNIMYVMWQPDPRWVEGAACKGYNGAWLPRCLMDVG